MEEVDKHLNREGIQLEDNVCQSLKGFLLVKSSLSIFKLQNEINALSICANELVEAVELI